MPTISIPQEDDLVNHDADEKIYRVVGEIAKVWANYTRIDVECRMRVGDLMSTMMDCDKRAIKMIVETRFGPGLYKTFRTCGWVAYKWRNLSLRNAAMAKGKAWRFFYNVDPETGEVTIPPARPELLFDMSSPEFDEGAVCVKLSYMDKKGRSIITRELYDQIGECFKAPCK